MAVALPICFVTFFINCALCFVYHSLRQSYIQSSLKNGGQGGPEITTWEQGKQCLLPVDITLMGSD